MHDYTWLIPMLLFVGLGLAIHRFWSTADRAIEHTLRPDLPLLQRLHTTWPGQAPSSAMQPLRARLGGLALAVGALLTVAPAEAATDVGVSVSIAQPGVYGRIDIGRFPAPTVITAAPVIVERTVVRTVERPVALREPVYMWVPPGHRKHWDRHCARYRACGVPVYFVSDGWYRQHVVPAAPSPRATAPGPRAMPPHARHDAHPDDREHRGRGHGKGRDRD